ncbi:ferritin-like domain-containing protein [Galbibacter pacificus]|uniref:PA2169 family four-helix-bundle protein n=1 Tax=Galbibacter pacificus TaxID=2996052 RepID=A0ABT6FQ42_9FLAO|nr:PA2169 family four-helix-bundle protein [Galbibacter pacificus]MDG3582293.1 PA2169 family four-helix-bundle protein [Galbibacter pacificus]MDG3585231.1 PA2169 family four-helix-bundle protein [Galbibacter pacificus]
MKQYTEKIGDSLNEILVKNIDAQNGFQRAIDHTDNKALIHYFRNLSRERKEFISELQDELVLYGEKFKFSGTISEDIHMGWIDFKSLFTKFKEEAMLEEAIRGEKAALEEYNEALKSDIFPASTATILRSQRDRIQAGINKIRSIKDFALS